MILIVSVRFYVIFCINDNILDYILAFLEESKQNGKCLLLHWLWIQALFFKLLYLCSRPPQTVGVFLEMSIAGRKCLCESGKVFLWSIHWAILMLVSMSYLKLWNYIYDNISSVPSSTGGQGRPLEVPWRQREAAEATSCTQVFGPGHRI